MLSVAAVKVEKKFSSRQTILSKHIEKKYFNLKKRQDFASALKGKRRLVERLSVFITADATYIVCDMQYG